MQLFNVQRLSAPPEASVAEFPHIVQLLMVHEAAPPPYPWPYESYVAVLPRRAQLLTLALYAPPPWLAELLTTRQLRSMP